MTEKEEQWSDRIWGWVLKVAGLGVFLFAATVDENASFSIAFLGIVLAVFPVADVRAILRNWRRGNGSDGRGDTETS